MIFSKLFGKKNKWQSDKPSERIVAVAELDLEGDKSTLHELAFNDPEASVRRAALDKLNDFSLFWQANKKDPSQEIKRFAVKRTKQILLDPNNTQISEQEKLTFIRECKQKQLIVDWLDDFTEPSLLMEALKRIDKEKAYFEGIMSGRLDQPHEVAALEKVTDKALLKRLSKKATDKTLEAVEAKLAELEQNKLKPEQTEKQAKLILAQLLNLKSVEDYATFEQRLEELTGQWQSLKSDWGFLDEHLASEFDAKFENIQQSLFTYKTELSAEEEALKQAAKQLEAEQSVVNDIEHQIDKLANEINANAQNEVVTENEWSAAFSFLQKAIKEADISQKEKDRLVTRVESLQSNANELPKLIENAKQANVIIEQLKDIKMPESITELNEVSSVVKGLRNKWNDLLKSSGGFAKDLSQEYAALTQPLFAKFKELEKEQNFRFSGFKRKLSELEGLISEGKYREAFGLHKKLSFWLEDLNEYQRRQVEKRWTDLEEEVGKLRELQQDIAAPKRQELLAQIENLAEQPLIDATEQAHRVKVLRNDWNALGIPASEEEQQRNETFNELSEKAFAPCREFYQELEQERDKALKAKQLVLEQLKKIVENLEQNAVANWKELENLFNSLNKHWFAIGKVDRDKVEQLNSEHKSLSSSIKAKISAYHKENSEEKRLLIEKAKKIVEGDSSEFDKADTLKTLQNQWKKIGFAGRHTDNKLWNEFRALNNKVFDSVAEKRQEQKQASVELANAINEKVDNIETDLNNANALNELRDIETQLREINARDRSIQKQDSERIAKRLKVLEQTLTEKRKSLIAAQHYQQYEDLFTAVSDLASGSKANLDGLKPSWQSAISGQSRGDRAEITIKMEVLAERESPEQDQQPRKAIQMEMMKEKLQGGASLDIEDLLEQWLAAGPFTQDHLIMLERIKPIFK